MSSLKSYHQDAKNSGFTPYQSEVDHQISLLSKLNLNSQRSLDAPIKIQQSISSSDLLSMRSRKRKGSFQLQLKQSVRENRTFLNQSLIGKSSLNRDRGQLMNLQNEIMEYEVLDQMKKELSERSCPVGPTTNKSEDLFDIGFRDRDVDLPTERIKDRFLKTKNLLRNMSTYFHRFILYNDKAHKILQRYLSQKYAVEQIEEITKEFSQWVKNLSMNNFQEYQDVWKTGHKFTSIYKQLCQYYYINEAYCDVQHSRLSKETKHIAFRYMHQFITGLEQPTTFYRFK